MDISIQVTINAELETVWNAWVSPEEITRWNFASEEWACPKADINLATDGKFNYRMEAKDGSMGFDFEGQFIDIVPCELIRYKMEDQREVTLEFTKVEGGVTVIEKFDAEDENSAEQQRAGWLSILNNFKKHVESKAGS